MLSPFFSPATVYSQHLPLSPAFVSAYSSTHTRTSPLSQLHGDQSIFLLILEQEKETSAKALSEHKNEAQSAQKKVEEHETCATAVAVAKQSLQRESVRLKSEEDGLKQLNEELMQKAVSTPQKRDGEKLDKIFSVLVSGMLGLVIGNDQSMHSQLSKKVNELCS